MVGNLAFKTGRFCIDVWQPCSKDYFTLMVSNLVTRLDGFVLMFGNLVLKTILHWWLATLFSRLEGFVLKVGNLVLQTAWFCIDIWQACSKVWKVLYYIDTVHFQHLTQTFFKSYANCRLHDACTGQWQRYNTERKSVIQRQNWKTWKHTDVLWILFSEIGPQMFKPCQRDSIAFFGDEDFLMVPVCWDHLRDEHQGGLFIQVL